MMQYMSSLPFTKTVEKYKMPFKYKIIPYYLYSAEYVSFNFSINLKLKLLKCKRGNINA